MQNNIYAQIAQRIIEQQESIIGPVAIEQAKKVAGLSVNWEKRDVKVNGDTPRVVDELVRQYEHLFGRLSVDVCRDATASLVSQLPPEKQPETLKA